jgi:predicted transcriptional regulator
MGLEDQQGIDRLFFELASESRLCILRELQAHALRMQQISKKLDLTETEACRQLQKLNEAQLVQKQPNGVYALTTYGRLILDLSSPMDFVLRNKEFFLKHDIFLLPDDLRARFGDLSGCQLVSNTIETINKVAEMVKTTRKRIDSVILGLESVDELMRQRCQEGVKVRWLIEENFIPRAPSILRSWQQLPEIRAIPSVIGHYAVTDTAAILTLRQNDGTMGFSSFIGETASFLKWTEELFMYEWQKAKPWHP